MRKYIIKFKQTDFFLVMLNAVKHLALKFKCSINMNRVMGILPMKHGQDGHATNKILILLEFLRVTGEKYSVSERQILRFTQDDKFRYGFTAKKCIALFKLKSISLNILLFFLVILGSVQFSFGADKSPAPPAGAIELVTLPKRENVQLTIYNSADLTLVRESRNIVLKKGWNWLQYSWSNTLIDPTSLSLEPKEQKDKIDIQALVFPPRQRELGRWLIHSEYSGLVPFEITYLTSGLSWRSFYMGTLSEDEKSMGIKGYVRVSNNSGEDYEEAQTRLIVGQVHLIDEIAALARRQYPYDSPIGIYRGFAGDFDNSSGEVKEKYDSALGGMPILGKQLMQRVAPKQIVKEGLSEYFLYSIEGTENIENQWSKRLLSFEADDIKVESLYKYDEGRYGNQTIRFIKFANDEEHNLGETPLPDGNVKIYGLEDKEGHLSYVGGTNVKYIPVNEKVELNLGAARLVEVKPTLMDLKTEHYIFDPNNIISGWDEIQTWKIEITNTKQIPATIEITRDFGTQYWTLQSETPYDKYDVTRIRYNMNIEPRAKREIEYTVTTYHGRRQDEYNK